MCVAIQYPIKRQTVGQLLILPASIDPVNASSEGWSHFSHLICGRTFISYLIIYNHCSWNSVVKKVNKQ